jgi:hypothetical protein
MGKRWLGSLVLMDFDCCLCCQEYRCIAFSYF